jgi:hypothetical protein
MSIDEQNEFMSDAGPDTGAKEEEASGAANDDEEIHEGIFDDELEEEFLEEEVLTESEERPKTQYQVKNKSNAVAAVGDHAQVTIYNYIQIIGESRKGASEDESDTSGEDVVKSKYELIEKALKLERQSGTFPASAALRSEATEAQLLTNEDEIASWYYKLDEYEQCYVQAVAILHGAAVREVSRRADNLYMQVRERERQHAEAIAQGAQQAQQNIASTSSTPLGSRSSKELQVKTCTITRRIKDVERLFWRDIDSHGISTFEFRLLDFLASEFMNKGLHGQNLLETIRQWSQESEKEYSWLSARALGIFLWRQDVDELRRRANEWARNYSLRGWRRTAMLLDGAYEIDSLKYPEKGNGAKVMPVLRLLAEWVKRGQQAPRPADIYVKCAAANTYGLIGKRKLEVALDGLKQLLPLTRSESTQDANKLFAAVVSAYISLSWSGHTSGILAHLAHIAAEAVLQHSSPHRLVERDAYRLQCEAQLDVTLKVFFLIAADSFSEASANDSTAYSKPLPDPLGRDVVLTGLLQDTNGWREQVITLLCAAIVERNRSNRLAAFDLIRCWTENLLKMQVGLDGDEKKQDLTSFTQFMVALGETINSWCRDLKKRKKYSSPANIFYKKQLEQWSRRKHPIASLAKNVLFQLSARISSEQ